MTVALPRFVPRRLPAAYGLALAALACSLCATGCVRRQLTVRSNPPGALVYIDDREIGTTPVSTEFIYYGTRKVQLVKDGYETVTVRQNFHPPWYQYPPLDFVTENLLPRELRDERVLDFQLEPQRVVPTEELLGRAENLRRSVQQGYVAPPPAAPRNRAGTPLPEPVPALPPVAGPAAASAAPPASGWQPSAPAAGPFAPPPAPPSMPLSPG